MPSRQNLSPQQASDFVVAFRDRLAEMTMLDLSRASDRDLCCVYNGLSMSTKRVLWGPVNVRLGFQLHSQVAVKHYHNAFRSAMSTAEISPRERKIIQNIVERMASRGCDLSQIIRKARRALEPEGFCHLRIGTVVRSLYRAWLKKQDKQDSQTSQESTQEADSSSSTESASTANSQPGLPPVPTTIPVLPWQQQDVDGASEIGDFLGLKYE